MGEVVRCLENRDDSGLVLSRFHALAILQLACFKAKHANVCVSLSNMR